MYSRCDCCDKTFSNSKIYREHKFRLQTINQLICDICGKTFKSKKGISNHFIIKHSTLETKFKCEICHKR